MTIPVVQGYSVPAGGDDNKHYGTTSATTPYQNAATAETDDQYEKPEKQPNQFRDVGWAVLFILHLAAILVLIVMNLVGGGNGDGGGEFDISTYSGLIWLVGISAIVSAGISSLTLGFMMKYATALVKISLIFTVLMSLLVAVLGFMSGQIFLGIMGAIMFGIGICYAKVVWPRIPFAAANLNTSLTAVKSNMGLVVVAYLVLMVAFVWSALWFIGLGEAVTTSGSGGIMFFLFLSYYWVHQVLSNTLTVTTAGTVGTWWFVPDEANSCWSTALQDSFCRATTYSFGSICLGSLLVAIVQALRALAHMSRDNDDLQMLTCIIDCILACIQDIIEYLNKWAYVYVGLYGFGYFEAGKNVIQLFQHKGWTVIISDDLCDRVLLVVSLGVGLLTGLISLALAAADPNLLASLQLEEGVAAAGFIIGFLVGLVICSILMSVVGAGVNTVIVCYAESPAEFEVNHPQLSAEMRSAWRQAWPELIN